MSSDAKQWPLHLRILQTFADRRAFLAVWLLTTASLPYSSIDFLSLSEYPLGLLQALPISSIILLAMLTLCLIASAAFNKSSKFLLPATMFQLLMWGILPLTEVNPRPWDAYLHYADSAVIAQTGSIPSPSALAYVGNYPSAFLDYTTTTLTTGIDPDTMLRVFPLISVLFTTLALYVLFRDLLGDRAARAALALAILGTPYFQFYLSPQALGLILAVLALGAISKSGLRWRFVAITLFFFVASGHPTSLVFLLAFCIVLLGVQVVRKRFQAGSDTPLKSGIVLTFVVVWVAWFLFFSVWTSSTLIPQAYQNLSNIMEFGFLTESTAGERLGSPLSFGSSIRTIALGSEWLVTGLLLVWTRRRIASQVHNFLLCLYLTPILLVGFDLVFLARGGLSPSGVLIDRFFLWITVDFAMVVATTFGVLHGGAEAHEETSRNSQRNSSLLRSPSESVRAVHRVLVVCGVIAIVTVPTIYYQESLYVVGTSARDASEFLSTTASTAPILGGKLVEPIWTGLPMTHRFRETPLFQSYPNQPTGGLVDIDAFDYQWYVQWYGPKVFMTYSERAGTTDRIYDSGQYQVYSV